MLRLGALSKWTCACADIRTAFLNAPRRDRNKLLAMEIPVVFRKLGLAESHHIWVTHYIWTYVIGVCIVTKRCQKSPGNENGVDVKSQVAFKRTQDENVWRIEEVDSESCDMMWSGLMSIYVDDLLFAAEDGAIDAATAAIETTSTISAVEKTRKGKVVKYCGFEIEAMDEGGFKISQNKYEMEMLQRGNITKAYQSH